MYREETQHFHSKCIHEREREREREREGNMACLLINMVFPIDAYQRKIFIFMLILVQLQESKIQWHV